MRTRERFSAPVVGGSSLLVIFAVLCLTVFALLGLSTVQADRRLADASVAAISDYYKADCQAEAVLARLRGGECPEGVEVDGTFYSYSCSVSDTRRLRVVLHRSEDQWEILSWKVISTLEWESEDDLLLWDGESISIRNEEKSWQN